MNRKEFEERMARLIQIIENLYNPDQSCSDEDDKKTENNLTFQQQIEKISREMKENKTFSEVAKKEKIDFVKCLAWAFGNNFVPSGDNEDWEKAWKKNHPDLLPIQPKYVGLMYHQITKAWCERDK